MRHFAATLSCALVLAVAPAAIQAAEPLAEGAHVYRLETSSMQDAEGRFVDAPIEATVEVMCTFRVAMEKGRKTPALVRVTCSPSAAGHVGDVPAALGWFWQDGCYSADKKGLWRHADCGTHHRKTLVLPLNPRKAKKSKVQVGGSTVKAVCYDPVAGGGEEVGSQLCVNLQHGLVSARSWSNSEEASRTLTLVAVLSPAEAAAREEKALADAGGPTLVCGELDTCFGWSAQEGKPMCLRRCAAGRSGRLRLYAGDGDPIYPGSAGCNVAATRRARSHGFVAVKPESVALKKVGLYGEASVQLGKDRLVMTGDKAILTAVDGRSVEIETPFLEDHDPRPSRVHAMRDADGNLLGAAVFYGTGMDAACITTFVLSVPLPPPAGEPAATVAAAEEPKATSAVSVADGLRQRLGGGVVLVGGKGGLNATNLAGDKSEVLDGGSVDWLLVDSVHGAVWYTKVESSNTALYVLDLQTAGARPVLIVPQVPLGEKGVESVQIGTVHGVLRTVPVHASALVVNLRAKGASLHADPALQGNWIDDIDAWSAAIMKVSKVTPEGRALLEVFAARAKVPPAAPPTTKMPSPAVDKSRCDLPDDCGKVRPLPASPYWLVETGNSCGDGCYVDLHLFDAARGVYVDIADPKTSLKVPPSTGTFPLPGSLSKDATHYISDGKMWSLSSGPFRDLGGSAAFLDGYLLD